MKIVYMGTPRFAVPPLRALVAAGHGIPAAVTRTDKPAGRGKLLTPPAVKTAAAEMGIPVLQPKRARDPEFIGMLRSCEPDAIVVAAYGQILPKELLELPRFGCINIHASLLPAYRGAAPINWAIIRGERETGITIMQMDEGMDTGAVLLQERVPIDPEDTAGTLAEKLSLLGARMIAAAMPLIGQGALPPVPQRQELATLAPLLRKEDGRIEWTRTAVEIHDRVRGLSPWPGAYTFLDGKLLKLVRTEVADGSGEPGSISARGKDLMEVGTGGGLLRVLSLQPEGKKTMTAAEFLRGHKVEGKNFETRS